MASSLELSFLYQTKTILRPKSSPVTSRWTARFIHQSLRTRLQSESSARENPTDIADTNIHVESNQPSSFLREKAQAAANRAGIATPSTITPAERIAFRKLRQAPTRVISPGSDPADPLNTDVGKILELFSTSMKAYRASLLNRKSVDSVITDSDRGGPTSSSTFTITKAPSDSGFLYGRVAEERVLEEGKQALEQAANELANQTEENLVDRVCRRQMEKIALIFTEATKSADTAGDLELWRALQTHVFPMIYLLSPTETLQQHQLAAARKALPIAELISASTSTSTSTSTSASVAMPSPTPEIPPLTLITRLYPSLLLLAQRLYLKSYPLSPFASSLLARIRSLGPASYILGANTHLYNAVLALRWTVHGSARELCSLLSEMERGAVEFDKGTYDILDSVRRERERDLRRRRYQQHQHQHQQTQTNFRPIIEETNGSDGLLGPKDANWWRRPEQVKWFAMTEEWRSIIARRLESKGQGIMLREGPYDGVAADVAEGEADRDGDEKRSTRDRAVWL